VGGAITNFAGWRRIFLVKLPFSALLIAATVYFVGESKDPGAQRLDLAGIMTFSLGLGRLIWALVSVAGIGALLASVVNARFSAS
jgi:hypothetical protein